jgi:oxaloacetate decarboxylase
MDWTDRRERLRAIISGPRCIYPGSVYDAISARIAEDLGFEAGMFAGSIASFGASGATLIPITEGVGKMKAALAGRQDKRLIIIGRTSAMAMTGVADTIARLKAYEEAGVDMLFMTGVKTRAQLDAVAAAVKLPLFLGGAGAELYDLEYLSARNVRVCLQGHMPFMAAVNATYETLKALREGVPPASIKSVASADLMKQVTRQADYAKWSKEFLQAGVSS